MSDAFVSCGCTKKASGSLGTSSDPNTQIYSAFTVDDAAGDVVLQKTRCYAGTGNELEEILCTQAIDTVILSGIGTSGVILSTAYRLFEFEIQCMSTTRSRRHQINDAILEGIIPKLPANVITIEQAVNALKMSGPAVY